jgi:hypothetical protein
LLKNQKLLVRHLVEDPLEELVSFSSLELVKQSAPVLSHWKGEVTLQLDQKVTQWELVVDAMGKVVFDY